MKPRCAFSLLTGVALLGAIAKLPPDVRASTLGDAAETARLTAQSLLRSTAATDDGANSEQPTVRVPLALQKSAAPRRGEARTEFPPGNPLWALPLKQLSATLKRPIFSASRRPPSPPPTVVIPVEVRQPVKPPEPERPPALVGTVIGNGDDRLGVFVDTSTQDIVRLRIGEDYHDWVVRSINSREATLMKDGNQAVVLELPSHAAPPSLRRSASDVLLDEIRKVGAE
jgi:general secretion pathway protein N